MSCKFNIPLSISESDGSLKTLIAKVAKAIEDNGGDLVPTDNGGAFSVPTPLGTIEGNFVYANLNVSVDIISKPWLVSCSKIETRLREYLYSALN